MRRWRLTGWIGIGLLGAVGWLLLAGHAQATGPGAQAAQAATSDVGTLLAPLLAAATGIERIIEMGWNLFESAFQQTVAALGLGQSWAQYARDEVNSAET